MLPSIDISMSLQLSKTDQLSTYMITDTSSSIDFLFTISILTCMVVVGYFILLLYHYISNRRHRGSSFVDDDCFAVEKKTLQGHGCKIDMVLSDGVYVISASLDGLIRVLDLTSTECVLEVQPCIR